MWVAPPGVVQWHISQGSHISTCIQITSKSQWSHIWRVCFSLMSWTSHALFSRQPSAWWFKKLHSLCLVGFTFMYTEQTFTVIPYHWLEKPGAEHKRYMQLVLGVRCCQQEMSQSPHRTICSSPDYNQSQAWKDMRGYKKGIWYTNLYIILTFKGPQLSLALNPWVPWILSNTWYPRAGIYRESDKSDWKCSCQS